ncbi:endonuclease/exonuclease/phosphatase family protein [Solwaraspora sp. WMMD1047]|uniref:endonuclease/exonuclease/phosphatase family protein n=1 Tax=Solwaraspora sp. WMMD1047 TaxID=3016102 RepID=UPI002417262D|nr:endonuclease/exonuclease/phosphatase family protein [Solwaraspora sp. WMMD1047]MDG4834863.1 endonuclease/exonuclease/phosphatase family protein [Solwaraspora sp. WMMD1047]
MTDQITIATYNVKDYRRAGETDHHRWEQVEHVIRDVGPHILMVQEIPGGTWRDAADGLAQLAAATGMRGDLDDGRWAAVPGGHDRLGLGILWKPGINPVPASWLAVSGTPLWHALAVVTLDIGGHRLVAASYHAPPAAGRDRRPAEAEFIVDALTGHSRGQRHEIWLGGDFNNPAVCADPRGASDHAGRSDGPQPTPGREHPPDDTDRRPGRILETAGFLDTAIPENGGRLQATTGHWPSDRNGHRRIDRILLRPGPAPVGVLEDHGVHDNRTARAASDHLLYAVRYRPPAWASR